MSAYNPTPIITKTDGVAVLDWGDLPNPARIWVAREVLEAQIEAINELAALKARRCDGCKWWDLPGTSGQPGECRLPDLCTGSPVDVLGERDRGWLFTAAYHACNAWSARA